MKRAYLYIALCAAVLFPTLVRGQAADVFITPTGAPSGICTANVHPLSFFNASGNWGAGAGQIGPATVVHLCGTFTAPSGANSFIQFQGSGTSGNPIILRWEAGTTVQAPFFGQLPGAIDINGKNFITLDGGTSGILQNTANGTNLANQQTSVFLGNFGTNFTVVNLAMLNEYVHVIGDGNGEGNHAIHAVSGPHMTVGPGNIFTYCDVCVFFAWNTDSDLIITGNTFQHRNQSIEMGPANTGTKVMTNVRVDHNIDIADRSWDDPSNSYHHNFFHPFTNTAGSSMVGTLQLFDNQSGGDLGQHSTSLIFIENNNGGSGGTMGAWFIFNNTFEKTNTDALTSSGIVAPMSQNGFFLNNTIRDAGGSGNNAWASLHLYSNGWTLRNNIWQGGGFLIYAEGGNPVTAGTNVYFQPATNTPWILGGSFFGSLGGWQGACNCDATSVTTNPVLDSTLHVGAGSSANGLAQNLTFMGIPELNRDKAGSPRPPTGPWTAGAFNSSGAAAPLVSIAPSPVPFGNQTQGVTSAPITVTISNVGNANLVLNTPFFSISGPNGTDFVNAGGGTCVNGGTVIPGGSCTMRITFTPATQNAESGVLGISGNATASANLSGTGTAPATAAVNITPNPIAFGNQIQATTSAALTVTVRNTGTANLNLSTPFFTITGANAADFARTGGTCVNAGTLAPNATCTLTMTFTPAAVGVRSATLNILGNANGSATLSGTGTAAAPGVVLSPSPVAFGSQTQFTTSAAIVVTVTNNGTGALVLNTPFFTISGTNGADFVNAGGGTCVNGGTVAAGGGSCTVRLTFTPATQGAETGVLGINGNATGSVNLTGTGTAPATAAVNITPNPIAFGNQTQGVASAALTVTVRNTGTATLTLNTPFFTITGTNAADFARTGGTCANAGTLAPNATCTLTMTFTPAALGARSASLNIAGNASGSAALTGTGVIPATPGISVTPTTFDYGNQLINTTSTLHNFTITSTGGANLVLSTPFFTISGGTNPLDFARVSPGGADCVNGQSLPNGATCLISVAFTPSTAAAESATLRINGNASGTAALTGAGISPAITLTPNPVPFGNITQGVTSGALTVTVRNTGNATLTLNTPLFTITGTNAADFAHLGGTCVNAGTLAPNATCTFTVTFTPSAPGARTATLTVNGSSGTSATTALTGTGLAIAPAVTISPRPVNFPNTNQGVTSAAITVTVTNSGGSNLVLATPFFTITGANAADFARLGGTCTNGGTVAASASCTITITFTPTATITPPAVTVAETATLTINGNASSFTAMNGTGVTVGPPPVTNPPMLLGLTLPAGTLKCSSFFSCKPIPLSLGGTNFLSTTKITLDGAALSTACTSVVCTATIPSSTVSLPGFGSSPHTISFK